MILLALALALVWGILAMLAEVQALKDQVAASVSSNARVKASLVALTAKNADLAIQLTAALANAVTAEDKSAVAQATADLKASEADLVSAVPA